MVGDTAGERSIVRGTKLGRAWIMFYGASDVLASDVGMKRAGRGRMAALCLALLLHAGGALLMVTTEISLAGVAVFLLVWVMLNCLWLALLRRPTVAALISLGILIVLTLLSRFKFDKLWMTIDFVDVMIVDRDTTAFLLEIFPSLRWWILLAVIFRVLIHKRFVSHPTLNHKSIPTSKNILTPMRYCGGPESRLVILPFGPRHVVGHARHD